MEVTYQLERRDYLGYNRFVVSRVPALKRQALIQMFVLPVILALELKVVHVPLWVYGLIVLILAGLWNAYLLWVRRRAVIALADARPGAIGLHTLALAPDGIREQTSVIEAFVRWSKVTEIAENKELVVLFFSPRFGFLIPKRAFPTAEGAQAFLETARAYHKSALDGTAPILPEMGSSWPPAPQRLS